MDTLTIIGFVLVVLYVIYSNGRTRRIDRERYDSLKGRVRSMDRHHHDMINRNHSQAGKDFTRFLNLMGYKRMDINSEENLILVEDFKGKMFVAEDKAGSKFVPVTVMTPEKGIRTVEYKGNMLLFKGTNTDF